MTSSTHIQAKSLLEDLKSAKDHVSWRVGLVINALLAKAKEENPDNVALSVIEPLEPGPNDAYISHMNANDVRAILGQIVMATIPDLHIGLV
jgi:hypothetical protein